MKERLLELISHTELNINQFEKEIGSGNGSIRAIVDNDGGISTKNIEKIFRRFPVYNLDWLLTGRGWMLHTDNSKPPISSKPLAQNSIVTVDTSDNKVVPIVEPKASAGSAFILDEPDYYKDLPTFTFPGFFLGTGTYASFPVKGDSMHPTIKQGDYVIAREIDLRNIRNGEVYVVVYQADSRPHFFVKRAYYFVGEENVTLQSDNDDYLNEEIAVLSILKIYHVEACYTTQFFRVESSRGRFDRLEKRMDRIEKRLVP